VLAGLALLACPAPLAPFSLSPALSSIASFLPVILFVMARILTPVSRQFSRWRRRKPPRQRRASSHASFLQRILLVLQCILQCWLALLLASYSVHHLQNFLHGPIPIHASSLHPAFLQHRNAPFQTVSHTHHSLTPPSRSSQPPAHPGCDCTVTCTNNPVNPTQTPHAPAWDPDLGSDGVFIPSAFNSHLNSSFLVFTPIVSFLHPAQHQRAASSNLPAARCTAPAWWAHNLVPTCCIPGSHSISAFSDPVITNPVAAALRLPAELCRPGGFIAAVGAAAAETQHYLKAARSDWAKQLVAAASSVRSGLQRLAAWAASDGRSQQPGQAARSDQVSVTACTLTALHPCSWDNPAVLSVLWSEVLSGLMSVLPASLSVWWHVLCQFCVVNCNFIILLILSLICAESVFQLVWRVTGCGQELADAYSLIAASPQVHRMALRLQLYRSATGRQFKRFRTVRVLLRPQALHDSFAHTSRALGRAIAYGTALAMVLFIAMSSPVLYRGCRRTTRSIFTRSQQCSTPAGWSSTRSSLEHPFSSVEPRTHSRRDGTGGGGGGSYCAVPHRHDSGATRRCLEGDC
jgi:hypothetical protein